MKNKNMTSAKALKLACAILLFSDGGQRPKVQQVQRD